jgi:FLVCR family feline leukemia virus subgroup C receptor-related protein
MLSTFSSALVIGYFYSITTVLEEMMALYDFTDTQSSYLGTLFEFAGILGGIACSIILTKSPKYKLTSILISVLTIISKLYPTL